MRPLIDGYRESVGKGTKHKENKSNFQVGVSPCIELGSRVSCPAHVCRAILVYGSWLIRKAEFPYPRMNGHSFPFPPLINIRAHITSMATATVQHCPVEMRSQAS